MYRPQGTPTTQTNTTNTTRLTEPADEIGTYQVGVISPEEYEELKSKRPGFFDNENHSHLASQTTPWDEEKDD